MTTNRPWFAPKRFGYGAGLPIRWQGWVTLAVYVTLVALITTRLNGVAMAASLAIATFAFVFICYRKTQGGWQWRWGRPSD